MSPRKARVEPDKRRRALVRLVADHTPNNAFPLDRLRDLLADDQYEVVRGIFEDAQAKGYAYETVAEVLRSVVMAGVEEYLDMEGLWDRVEEYRGGAVVHAEEDES
jgi:hypothetical protein